MSSRIEVLNCRFVDPLNLRAEDVRLEDIAHSLAHQCRFNGYTSRPYSVAEHSVYVAQAVEERIANWNPHFPEDHNGRIKDSQRILRQALLHDATEAYLCDLPRPIKNAISDYKGIEERIWAVIAGVFDVPVELHPWIKEADMRMCVSEKVVLLSEDGLDLPEWAVLNDSYPVYEPNPVPRDWMISPRQARKRFTDYFAKVS